MRHDSGRRNYGPLKLCGTLGSQAYTACGGYPLYFRQWDARRSTRENLRRLAFTPGGVLIVDADGMLREELSPTGGYVQILAAIGRGQARRTRSSDGGGPGAVRA